MIKLVGVDVDGTLIDRHLEIPPRTREAIAAARARGVRFAIVTGRMYKSAARFAETLGLEGMPLVAYNGAMLAEFPSGRMLFHRPVPLDLSRKLALFCEEKGYHLQAYVGDNLYVVEMDALTERYIANAKVPAYPVGPLSRWLQEGATKLLIFEDAERIPQIRAEVEALLGEAVEATSSTPFFLEVTDRGVTKGEGLQKVAEALGVGPDEVMAIGDGMNDMPMLTWAGTSFAVAHAPDALKRAATYVTEAGPGDAVAEALERVGLA